MEYLSMMTFNLLEWHLFIILSMVFVFTTLTWAVTVVGLLR
jgi:hypothetical protein